MITSTAFILVLGAALIHAIWNSFVKTAGKKSLFVFAYCVVHILVGILIGGFSLFPSWEAFPYIITSAIVHIFYYFFLYKSYIFGDLSEVYPLMRGMAPILVTIGSFFLIGELPISTGIFGIIFISSGIILLSVHNFFYSFSLKAVLFAMVTGLCISIYSLLDGLGVRQTEEALSYISWLFIIEGIGGSIVFWIISKKENLKIDQRTLMFGFFGGILSCLAYGIVIYVKMNTQLGIVSSLRETSVIFGSLIGIIIFKERPVRFRIFSALIVTIGLILISFS